MFTNLDQAQAYVRDNKIAMIDLKFSDLAGRWHHVTLPASQFNGNLLRDGVGFDASSVGLKPVKAGDMVLLPDLSTAFRDPFWEAPTLSFIASAYEAALPARPAPHRPARRGVHARAGRGRRKPLGARVRVLRL
jgi:glutamine synthetase